MRVIWVVGIVLFVVGLVAWSTTCTGPRPEPTGETLPPGATSTSVLAPTGGG